MRLVLALSLLAAAACTTPGEREAQERPQPPAIVWNMPLEDALKAGVDFGQQTLVDVQKLVKKRKEGPQASKILVSWISDNLAKWDPPQLINAGRLYMAQPGAIDADLFRELVRSERPLANQVGWQLAAVRPGETAARAVEAELTRALNENDETSVLIPQMANAVASNQLKSAYTLLRRGLMVKGDQEFAAAMMMLAPEQASEDFLVYLGQVPGEELRQLTLVTVDPYTCVGIMRHLIKVPPSVANPHFDHLYFYAVSRNIGLAELAQEVIESYVPQRTELLAQVLARQPTWVQMAYLESARRKRGAKIGLLLSELKKVSAEEDVIQEIDELKL